MDEYEGITPVQMSVALDALPTNQSVWPGPVVDSSSVDTLDSWRLPRLFDAASRLQRLGARYGDKEQKHGYLAQAMRELLMAYSLPAEGPHDPKEWREQIAKLRQHTEAALHFCSLVDTPSNSISSQAMDRSLDSSLADIFPDLG